MTGYLSYSCLPIRSKLTGDSPLMSDISKAFVPRELQRTEYLLYILEILEMAVWGNHGRSEVSEIPRPANLAKTKCLTH